MSNLFGEKLRKLRTKEGLTLDQLAAMVGTRKAYIWQLENKRPAKPSGELLLALAKALNISAEFLIDDANIKPTAAQNNIALARGLTESGLSESDVELILNRHRKPKDGTKNPRRKSR